MNQRIICTIKKNLTLNLIDYDEQFILNKKTNKEIKKEQQHQQQKTKETLHQRKKREKMLNNIC